MWGRAGLGLGLAGALACGADNSLGGSVSELFPLEVSQVQILRNGDAFQVSYYRNNGADVDLVARLSVGLAGTSFIPGKSVSLAGEYEPGHQRATVLHLASGEPVRTFPDVKQGDIKLTEGGKIGEETSGTFSLSFVQSGDYGGGRSIHGNFFGKAADAGYGPDGDQPPFPK